MVDREKVLCPPLDVKAERTVFHGKCYSSDHSCDLSRKRGRIYNKCEEKRRKVYRMSCRGKLSRKREMPKKKLEGRVIGRKTMKISGMNCAHCATDVAMILNQIDGVRAEVNLAKGSAKISYDRTVGDDVLRNAVEKIGYHVTSIS